MSLLTNMLEKAACLPLLKKLYFSLSNSRLSKNTPVENPLLDNLMVGACRNPCLESLIIRINNHPQLRFRRDQSKHFVNFIYRNRRDTADHSQLFPLVSTTGEDQDILEFDSCLTDLTLLQNYLQSQS